MMKRKQFVDLKAKIVSLAGRSWSLLQGCIVLRNVTEPKWGVSCKTPLVAVMMSQTIAVVAAGNITGLPISKIQTRDGNI